MSRAAQTVDMTLGDPKKRILAFAFPIFLSQLFQQCYNAADTLIVGKIIGNEAQAAVSSSGSLIFLFVSFFVGTGAGAGVVISRYFGAGDEKKVSRAVHTAVLIAAICGFILSFVGVLFVPTVLRWMGTPENVLPQSVEYFQFYFLGSFASILYNTCTGVLNAVGDSRRPLYYLIFSSVLNVVLDVAFLLIFRRVAAAAAATVISQVASVLLCLRQLRKKGTVYCLERQKLKIDPAMLREILKNGLPTGVQNSVIGFANVLVQTNINSFGELAMSACGSYSKLEGFAFLPITCFSMALATFIGQNLGAKQYDRARSGARFGIWTSVIMAEVIGVLMFLLAPHLIGLFINTKEAGAAEILAIGVRQCRTISLFYCLLSFSHCIAGICRGAGKAVVPMMIMLSVWCIFRIIYITVAMNFSHDIVLLFWAYPITWTISSVIYLIYYLKSDWVHAFERDAERQADLAS